MVGLTNEGNTCYFNSALSCFIYTPYIANNYKLLKSNNLFNKEIINLFVFLFDNKFDSSITFDTKTLISKFKEKYKSFNNFQQQDSHDAFLSICESLPTILNNVYCGKLKRSLCCNNCKFKKIINEDFTTLYLNDGKLEDGINNYFDVYQIDSYICDFCKKNSTASCQINIVNLPKVIILKTRTQIPDLTIEINTFKFELYACIQYSGNSHFGHYTSCVKSYDTWYHINDEICTVMKEPVCLKNTCVLFYKQILHR